ncbi:MAG: ABC transporter permease, partial [Clostridiales bacterium]|nr:ABC transporter permease [Clostridiales bacterium]
MNKSSVFSGGLVLLALLFLYAPIAVLIAMSFNSSKYNRLPFEFSTRWYQDLFHDEVLLAATRNSILIAVATGILCVLLATLLVLGARALSRKLQRAVQSATVMTLAVPWLILGLSLLLLIRALDFSKNLFFLLAGHIVVALPYSVLAINARVQSLDPSLEEA